MTQVKADISSLEWKCIEFPSIGCKVPTNLMSRQILSNPITDPTWVINILTEYQPLESEDMKKIELLINSSNSSITEEEFKAALKLDMWDSKAYAMASLRSRGLFKRLDFKSVSILNDFSNNIISAMNQESRIPSKLDEIELTFCDKNNINWIFVKYHKMVIDYCYHIAPHPLKYVNNTDKDGHLALLLPGLNEQNEKTGNVSPVKDKSLAEYNRRKEETERRIACMFPDYRDSRYFLTEFTRLIAQEHPEIFLERFDLNYSTVTRNRNTQRSRKTNEKAFLLTRCEFCYRFGKMERKRGISPAWHCGSKVCHDRYKAWVLDLERKGINLETLYQ